MKRNAKVLLSIVITLCMAASVMSQNVESPSGNDLSINLKPRAVVVGPVITLGDIGYIVVQDSVRRSLLKSVRITDAPPPGESTEISLNYIKNRLKAAGFKDFASVINGPKSIRVTTAQIEIDKAFLREEFARLFEVDKIDISQLVRKSLQI
jgi:hypothetical protein